MAKLHKKIAVIVIFFVIFSGLVVYSASSFIIVKYTQKYQVSIKDSLNQIAELRKELEMARNGTKCQVINL